MKLDLNNVGERLQQLRKALDISQLELATNTNLNQNQVSRLENGSGGSLEGLFNLINFYSDHFHMNTVFSESFEPVKKSDAPPQVSNRQSVAVEKLKSIHSDLGRELIDVINILENQEN